jgi:hypothetical protein
VEGGHGEAQAGDSLTSLLFSIKHNISGMKGFLEISIHFRTLVECKLTLFFADYRCSVDKR